MTIIDQDFTKHFVNISIKLSKAVIKLTFVSHNVYNSSMFNTAHIIFMIVAFVLILAGELLAGFFVRKNGAKRAILITFAVATVLIHFSSLWVDYLSTGAASVDNTMLFLIYPCNIAMWLLLIVALLKNTEGKFYKIVAEFTFYLGIVGGIIGIVFNEIYANSPTFADWHSIKGLFSHATLIFGCIYLAVGGFIKIRVRNTISVAIGMLFMVADGAITIGIFRACNLEAPNAMYLLANPFENMPWLNTWTIGVAAVVLTFAITALVEQCALKREDRTLVRLFKGGKK